MQYLNVLLSVPFDLLTSCIVFFCTYGSINMYVSMYVRGVFVFKTTKTKNPKFNAEFDLKLRGKDRTENNLTGYTLTSVII